MHQPVNPFIRSATALGSVAIALTLSSGVAAVPNDSPFGPTKDGISGQIRLRTEFDHKRMTSPYAGERIWTLERARLGYVTSPSENLLVKVEIQDSRAFGSGPESNGNPISAPSGDAKGVDLLQAYFLRKLGKVQVAAGRQRITMGSGRVLERSEWNNHGRSYDGISANGDFGKTNVTALLYLISDRGQQTMNDHVLLSGLFFNQQITSSLALDLYSFYDQSRLPTTFGQGNGSQTSLAYDLFYSGERLSGRAGIFAFEEEFIWQSGELNLYGKPDAASQAFQISTRAGIVAKNVKANLGFDMMSGDDGSDKTVSTLYRASYYAGHSAYGWMDYFTTNPRLGVMDFRVDIEADLLAWGEGKKVTVKAQNHFFLPAKTITGVEDPYGNEVDGEINVSLIKGCTMAIGGGVFIPGNSADELKDAALGNGDGQNIGTLLYIMPTVNF